MLDKYLSLNRVSIYSKSLDYVIDHQLLRLLVFTSSLGLLLLAGAKVLGSIPALGYSIAVLVITSYMLYILISYALLFIFRKEVLESTTRNFKDLCVEVLNTQNSNVFSSLEKMLNKKLKDISFFELLDCFEQIEGVSSRVEDLKEAIKNKKNLKADPSKEEEKLKVIQKEFETMVSKLGEIIFEKDSQKVKKTVKKGLKRVKNELVA